MTCAPYAVGACRRPAAATAGGRAGDSGEFAHVPGAEVRAWAEAMMDERARSGAPYVFAGLRTSR